VFLSLNLAGNGRIVARSTHLLLRSEATMRAIALLPFLLAAACGGTPEAPVVPAPDSNTVRDMRTRDSAAARAQTPAAAAQPARAVAAPASPSEGRFLLVQGANPIATEEFRRTAGGFEADLQPSGGQPGLSYQARVSAQALIDSMTIEMGTPTGGTQRLVLTLEESGDSALVHYTQWEGDSAVRRTVGTRAGAVFYLNPSPSIMEQIVRRARAVGGDSVAVPLFMPVGAGSTAVATVTFPHADSAVTSVGGVAIRMRVDAEGQLLGGAVPVQGLTIEREDAAR
jgi:hypothetical protein